MSGSHNTATRNWLITGVLVILGLLIFWLYTNIEAYEIEINKQYGEQAYQERYLGLQRQFALYDIDISISESSKSLFSDDPINGISPNSNDILIFTESDILLRQSLADEILAWVDGGGRIIMGLQADNTISQFLGNRLLTKFGVETRDRPMANSGESSEDNAATEGYVSNTDDQDGLIQESGTNEDDRGSFQPTLLTSSQYGDLSINLEDEYYIHIETKQAVAFSAGLVAATTEYPTLVQIEYGKGTITLMTDAYIWNNFQLQNADNVIWAHELLGDADRVFLFEIYENEWWYQVIALYSPSFYWILLTLICICGWYASVRFGAIKYSDSTVVTYFTQHISAAGEYYWANKQREKLINDVRKQVLEEIAKRTAVPQASNKQLIDSLAKVSLWPRETIEKLVLADPVGDTSLNETQFVKIMQGLQQLRKLI